MNNLKGVKILLLLLGIVNLAFGQQVTNLVYVDPNNQTEAAIDPFKEYINSVPGVIRVLSDSTIVKGDGAITVRKVILRSRNGLNSIYAIMAFPKRTGKFPAIMFLHGGGGRAETMLKNVIEYAHQGYVTISPDQPGICKSENVFFSSGPWKSKDIASSRFDLSNGAASSILADGIIADLEVFNYLSAQQNVEAGHIGITGTSWGGYATTMLSGLLGKRLRAAYSVYGSGFYDKGSNWAGDLNALTEDQRKIWLTYLDAGRRAKNIEAPYFVEAPTNDTFFWPEAVSATLGEIKGLKNHTWTANRNHRRLPSGAAMQKIYFDYYLKNIGSPFGHIQHISTTDVPGIGKKIRIAVNVPAGIRTDSVTLFYSLKGEKWQKRVWIPVSAQYEKDQTYTMILPKDLLDKDINYYCWAIDSRKVAFSSQMWSSL